MSSRERSPAARAIRVSIAVSVLLAVVAVALHSVIGVRVIESAYRGESIEPLNRLFSEHRAGDGAGLPLAHYQLRGRVWLSRALLLLAVAELGLLAWLARDAVRRGLRTYFRAEGSPVNLAVFRIFIFSALLAQTFLEDAVWWSGIPGELEHMPFGSGWLAPVLPFDPETTGWLVAALRIACISGILGVFSRTSALLSALLGFYVVGVPQFFGKVNHLHHMIWFPLVLAASRSGDVLSVDAAFAAAGRADRGAVLPPGAARCYGLPLRIVWLLFGVIYFFPGFWKYWQSGIDWAISDNMRYQLYWKWQELDGWLPFLRIDRLPWVNELGGLGTLAFEMGFLGALFHPRLRRYAIAAGFGFHVGVRVFMNILFWSVMLAYSAFVDWDRGFRWLGLRLFREPLVLLYDGNCGLCRRTIAILGTLDLLGRIQLVNALDPAAVAAAGAGDLDPDALLRDMHARIGGRTAAGYDAYRWLALRIPPLWPLVPLLYLWPVTAIGKGIYRRVADSRVCALPPWGKSPPPAPVRGEPSLRPLALVAALLVAGNVYCGANEIVVGWPFANYPTFSAIRSRERTELVIELIDAEGRALPPERDLLRAKMGTPRHRAMMSRILETPPGAARDVKLAAFWRLHIGLVPAAERGEIRAVRFHRETVSVIPEERSHPPIARELLLELPLPLPQEEREERAGEHPEGGP